MRIFLTITSILIFMAMSVISHATYNANMTGVVTKVKVYDTGGILFITDTQPSSHPGCTNTHFEIDISNEDYKNRMLSRLLTAKATGETITIGYDNAGDCAYGYIRVHEIG